MNKKLYEIFDIVLQTDYSVKQEREKTIIEVVNDGKYGHMETYSLFPGVLLAFMEFHIENMEEVFIEKDIDIKILEINHCTKGRYAYTVGEDKIIYFGPGDLCLSIYELTKSLSDFPLSYYEGLEVFIDVELANEHIKHYIPNFDLVEFYESLKREKGFVLVRSNEKIEHVIGEMYHVDERIQNSYYKLKTLELLLFFSITKFNINETTALSKNQVEIIDNVKEDLINNLDSKITIEELSNKYGISKTALKSCFKEIYGKPIYKWRKEYKLDYASKIISQGNHTIGEISKMVGYSSPSKFTQAFKEYKGYTPSKLRK